MLVLAPHFRFEIYPERFQLVRALIGQHVYVIPTTPGAFKPHSAFKPDGRLVKLHGSPAGPQPRFTRVSAVVTLEEVLRLPSDRLHDLDAGFERRPLVVHNPFAATPLSESVFANCPQMVRRDNAMEWTDGDYGY